MQSFSDFYQNSDYAIFPQEHRRAGNLGVSLIRADQKAHDNVNPACGEFVLGCLLDSPPGTASYHLGDKWTDFPPKSGTMVFMPPDTSCAWRATIAHKILLVALPKKALADAMQVDPASVSEKFSSVYERPFVDSTIWLIAQRMWQESTNAVGASAMFVDSAAVTIAALLQAQTGKNLLPKSKALISDATLSRVNAYVDEYFSKDINLGELAKVAGMSSHHFSRCFKATTGKTPFAFVMAKRVERATGLLISTDLPLSHVAYVCGFANQAHFTTVYRKHTGLTPGTVRRQSRL
jgi:AraC family transcriptional regulator